VICSVRDADRQALDALIARYRAAWCARDFAALATLFVDDDATVYLAEEIAEPAVGTAAIRRYFDTCARVLTSMDVSTGAPHVCVLGPDAWALFFPMRWRLSAGEAAPLAGRVHVSAVVVRDAGALRFVQYVEAPLGALPFVRAAYARAARERDEDLQ
jgi:uncharacterized protein (TIGR02246 family)